MEIHVEPSSVDLYVPLSVPAKRIVPFFAKHWVSSEPKIPVSVFTHCALLVKEKKCKVTKSRKIGIIKCCLVVNKGFIELFIVVFFRVVNYSGIGALGNASLVVDLPPRKGMMAAATNSGESFSNNGVCGLIRKVLLVRLSLPPTNLSE